MGIKNSSNIPDNEIVEIYVESKKIKASPNSRTISTNELFRQTSHNVKAFGLPSIFGGEFDFMTKIHRNVIRNLYDKYLYINVLDIGIGKCRDVYSYSKYVNRHDIYGVEPNKEFSKYCTIQNLFNSTADDIFKQFKLKGMTKKFHTIVFCNSYNFVTNPYITMKECEEFLDQNGRIIMIYMNNDKVVDVKNKYYEIRKGESDEHLPKDSPLVNRQNFIQVFSEVTLVPPHHENQISESDILGALEKLNKDLEEKNAPKLKLIEKGNMIHTQYSSWLVDEAKLFNSMFYYVVIGRPCKSPDLIIAFDPMTTTLQSYIDYLHKKLTFCNGIDILRFEDYEQQKFGEKTNEKTNEKTKTQCIAVKSIEQYEKLSKEPHELFINIQIKNELEYSLLYNIDIDFFIIERKKLLEKNPKHSKFGFPDSKSF
jgi:SAM-dependent methyltransferase